jgi:hypothetical protein
LARLRGGATSFSKERLVRIVIRFRNPDILPTRQPQTLVHCLNVLPEFTSLNSILTLGSSAYFERMDRLSSAERSSTRMSSKSWKVCPRMLSTRLRRKRA